MLTVMISSKGQIVLPATLRRRLGMDAGTLVELIAERDGLKLRAVRPVPKAELTKLAGMVTAPSCGEPRRLLGFNPSSLLNQGRSRKR